jgi:NADH:ubiquinone oxidoreductase subunit 2 (subunit N)
MGINMIGAIIIIMSKELFTMYLGLELYSFSTYLLITPKKNTQLQENLSTGIKKINIQYLFYNSFSSILLLIGVYIIYTKTGGFGEIKGYNSGTEDRGIPLELLLIIIALIFKLGGIPYTY